MEANLIVWLPLYPSTAIIASRSCSCLERLVAFQLLIVPLLKVLELQEHSDGMLRGNVLAHPLKVDGAVDIARPPNVLCVKHEQLAADALLVQLSTKA